MDELIALRERVAALESQLRELHELVAQSRAGGFRSMRDSRRCPACGGGALVHVRRASQASDAGVVPLGIVHVSRWTGVVAHGPLESLTCRACGLVELHVIDFTGVEADGKHVVAIDPEADPPRDGPFR